MKNIAVVGAGIIGICCALELKRKGFNVTLFDEFLPASQTSSGNAGVICSAGITPYASPEILPHLPAYALNIYPKFKFYWPHIFQVFPFLVQFVKNCNWRDYEQSVKALHYITRDAVDLHTKLMAEANSGHLLRDRGWLKLYRTDKAFAASARERQNYKRYGVSATILETDGIRELEPAIIRNYTKAILLEGSPFVTNPRTVCESYFNRFIALGGQFEQKKISQVTPAQDSWKIGGYACSYQFQDVVIAMGSMSTRLLSALKIKIPMAIERGYHLAFSMQESSALSRSILDTQKGLVMTPMYVDDQSLVRVTSAVNLIAHKTTHQHSQILNLIPEMHTMLPLDQQLLDEPWTGHRPSTPDSIPVIGAAPNNPGLWLAFGHGHLGLTLGPKTGKLIADGVAGDKKDLEADAFSADRFC